MWDKAFSSEDDKYFVVESPLHFDRNPGFIISNKSQALSSDKANGISRLLILKAKKSGATYSVLMHVYSSSGVTDANITYTKRGEKFSGFVFFTDLNGEFINGWLYENGKITKQSNGKSLPTNTTSKTAPEDCYTLVTDYYERDCIEYYNGNYQCGSWSYICSTYNTYCPSSGGDGGGGGAVYIERDCAGVANGTAYVGICNICMGGTTGITSCPTFDDRIEDSLSHDCLKNVLDSIKKIKSGEIADIIYQFSGETPNWNLTLKEGYAGGNNAQTDPFFTNGAINITFDYDKVGKGTDLAVARTMMHEAVHAYLVAYFINDQTAAQKEYSQLFEEYITHKYPTWGDAQHAEMGRTFVDQIAFALKQFGQNRGYSVSDQIYHDLAWGGLYGNSSGVPGFNSLSPSDRERIRYRNAAENSNTTKEGEVPAGIKNCN